MESVTVAHHARLCRVGGWYSIPGSGGGCRSRGSDGRPTNDSNAYIVVQKKLRAVCFDGRVPGVEISDADARGFGDINAAVT